MIVNTELKNDVIKLIKGMIILNIVVSVIAILITFSLSVFIGLQVGLIYMCWYLYYMALGVEASVEKTIPQGKFKIRANYIIRMAVLFVILIISAQVDFINYFAIGVTLLYPKIILAIILFREKGKAK